MADLKSPREILRDFEEHAKEDLLEELGKAVVYQRVRQTLEGIKTLLEFECDAALLAGTEAGNNLVPGMERAIQIVTTVLERKEEDESR